MGVCRPVADLLRSPGGTLWLREERVSPVMWPFACMVVARAAPLAGEGCVGERDRAPLRLGGAVLEPAGAPPVREGTRGGAWPTRDEEYAGKVLWDGTGVGGGSETGPRRVGE